MAGRPRPAFLLHAHLLSTPTGLPPTTRYVSVFLLLLLLLLLLLPLLCCCQRPIHEACGRGDVAV